MDYVNAPVGKGTRPRAAAQAAGRRADHHRHRRGEHHDLRARRARAEGEDRHQPRPAAADPGRRRPDADPDPAGRGHRRRRAWTSSATRWRATPPGRTRRTTRKQPEQRVPYCGANPIADMWSEKAMSLLADVVPARRCATATTPRPASEMAMAATFAGLGFGNAGVHIPHANAYPIAGRVQRLPPRGLPRRRADGAARHGGLADRARGVPVHLRGRARAAPARRRSCSRPDHALRRRPATRCPACSPT